MTRISGPMTLPSSDHTVLTSSSGYTDGPDDDECGDDCTCGDDLG